MTKFEKGGGDFLKEFFLDKSHNLFKFVSVLLSASVERVGVSRLRNFFLEASLSVNEFHQIYVLITIQDVQKSEHSTEPCQL